MKNCVFLPVVLLCGLLISPSPAQKPLVALDCFHNNENSPHYTWQLTSVGGYSQFAQLILGLGADTISIRTAMDSTVLAPVAVLIIADPDDSSEAANPNFMTAAEADVLDKWVQRGGSLMLLGNNKGNCDFTHFNLCAAKFGITFNQDTQAGGSDLGPLPQHALFTGCDTLHIVGISTQTLAAPAQAVFSTAGNVLISTALKGNGKVFAMGDPWVYNEYINSKDNKPCVTNVMKWLLGQTTGVFSHGVIVQKHFSGPASSTAFRMFLPNGRLISATIRKPSSMSAGLDAAALNAHGNAFIVSGPAGARQHISIR
jgi:unsaturated rhamnogalacturonyl hydrolase